MASTRFDNVGRSWQSTRPKYRTTTPGTYWAENWSNPGAAHTVTTYPPVTSSSKRTEGCTDGTNVEVSYRRADNYEWGTALNTTCGLTTRTWNRDGQLTKVVSDVRGNPTASTDTGGNTTSYEYNARSQLVEVTDPQSNTTTTYEYANWNVYGPTGTDDPDHGSSTLSYDLHGRLGSTVDARGVTLEYGYDLANRPLEVSQIESGTLPVTEWTYDPANGYGQVEQVEHWNRNVDGTSIGKVTIDYAYDALGRVDTVTHDIPGLPGGPATTGYEYVDSTGDVREVHYPGGVVADYRSDRQGRARWIGLTDPNNTANPNTRTVVGYTEYNAADQLVTLKRGYEGLPNALNTYYSYNDRDGTLDNSYTNSGPGTDQDQHLTYRYTPGGLITSILDESPQGLTKSCFQYSADNYLERAYTHGTNSDCTSVGTDNLGPEPYDVTYAYDTLGRITWG